MESIIRIASFFILIGALLIVTGILTLILWPLLERGKMQSKIYYGIGGFIGPFPFGFANDPRFLWIIVGLSFLCSLVFLLLVFY